MMLRICAI